MNTYVIHFSIWLLVVIICFVLEKVGTSFISTVAVLWGVCALFFVIYYVSKIRDLKKKKTGVAVNETGVFSGRLFGIFVNMFVLQYITELYKNWMICVGIAIVTVVILSVHRESINEFFKVNIWNSKFCVIYIAGTGFACSIYSFWGYFLDGVKLVSVNEVSFWVKIVLIILYILISMISVVPDSFIMKIATKNDMNK